MPTAEGLDYARKGKGDVGGRTFTSLTLSAGRAPAPAGGALLPSWP